MQIKIDNYKSFAIYGTGQFAKKLYEVIDDKILDEISCHIVSNGYKCTNFFCGKKVIEISDYKEKKDELIILAVEAHREQIIENLKEKKIDYYCFTQSDLRELYRKKHKIKTNFFLTKTKPVSSIFGLDRGTPIDRYYIEQFLNKESMGIVGVDKTLEVTEDRYSSLFFPNARHEILDFEKGMDLTKSESLYNNFYDVFICTQTFNFIYAVKSAIRGSYDLLAPGGTMLATVAGNISQVSRYDMERWGDYWRFTYKSIEMLVKEVFGEEVSVYPYGNSMAATAFIQGLCVEDVNTKLLDECDPEYAIVIGVVARKGKYK